MLETGVFSAALEKGKFSNLATGSYYTYIRIVISVFFAFKQIFGYKSDSSEARMFIKEFAAMEDDYLIDIR